MRRYLALLRTAVARVWPGLQLESRSAFSPVLSSERFSVKSLTTQILLSRALGAMLSWGPRACFYAGPPCFLQVCSRDGLLLSQACSGLTHLSSRAHTLHLDLTVTVSTMGQVCLCLCLSYRVKAAKLEQAHAGRVLAGSI